MKKFIALLLVFACAALHSCGDAKKTAAGGDKAATDAADENSGGVEMPRRLNYCQTSPTRTMAAMRSLF